MKIDTFTMWAIIMSALIIIIQMWVFVMTGRLIQHTEFKKSPTYSEEIALLALAMFPIIGAMVFLIACGAHYTLPTFKYKKRKYENRNKILHR